MLLRLVVLRLERPSGMCAKLRTVAASNNRDHTLRSLYCCLFAPHICSVVLRAHSVRGEPHIQRNAGGVVATVESLSCFYCIQETVFDDQSQLKFDTCWIFWQRSLPWLPSARLPLLQGTRNYSSVGARNSWGSGLGESSSGARFSNFVWTSSPRVASEASSRNNECAGNLYNALNSFPKVISFPTELGCGDSFTYLDVLLDIRLEILTTSYRKPTHSKRSTLIGQVSIFNTKKEISCL